MNLSKRILVSITGRKDEDWKSKLKEIEQHKIKKIALFLGIFNKEQRKKIYSALEKSSIKEIPLVHIRNTMEKQELELLEKFNPKCFTIHESSFKYLKKWKGFYNRLFLEMNYDNKIPEDVDVSRIGGFCIDLSHFKTSEKKLSKEYNYVIKRKNSKYFRYNHLNGYSYKENKDLHTVSSLKEFEYLKTLPEYLFGEYIAIETFNSIKDQLKFKEYVIKLLKDK